MRKYQIVAICWSCLNFGLASCLPFKGPFPWLRAALLALFPLLLICFANQIAANLHHGVIQRFARDRDEPQSPLVVMLIAWVVFALQTTALVVLLAA
jgi:hypothetical protein